MKDEGGFNMGLGVTIEKKRGTSPENGGPQVCKRADAPAPGPCVSYPNKAVRGLHIVIYMPRGLRDT
jgi:hypothetical protein